MALREFRDQLGREWRVWEVIPQLAERRRHSVSPPDGEERRVIPGARSPVNTGFERGWLAFETKGERRRLAPVPPRWEEFGELMLRALLDSAERAGRPRRLVE